MLGHICDYINNNALYIGQGLWYRTFKNTGTIFYNKTHETEQSKVHKYKCRYDSKYEIATDKYVALLMYLW